MLDIETIVMLLTDPHEDLNVEYKCWLDLSDQESKAVLAKAMIALANHGGGFVVIGFKDDGHLAPDCAPTLQTSDYTADMINNIVHAYAEPPFQCQLRWINHPDSDVKFPVVVVPGGHTKPIRTKRDGPNGKTLQKDKYYIRRPGPGSETPQTSSEWDELIRRCVMNSKEELLVAIRNVLTGDVPSASARESEQTQLMNWFQEGDSAWDNLVEAEFGSSTLNPFAHGTFSVAYKLIGATPTDDIDDLVSILSRLQNNAPKFSHWDAIFRSSVKSDYDTNDTKSWWYFDNQKKQHAAWSDYIRVRNDLSFFLRSGHLEDITGWGRPDPGTACYVETGAAQIMTALRHGTEVAQLLSASPDSIILIIRWDKMQGRQLMTYPHDASEIYTFIDLPSDRFAAKRDQITIQVGPIAIDQVRSNMPELLFKPIRQLYRAFNFAPNENRLRAFLNRLAAPVPDQT
jgi:hypothetical protein